MRIRKDVTILVRLTGLAILFFAVGYFAGSTEGTSQDKSTPESEVQPRYTVEKQSFYVGTQQWTIVTIKDTQTGHEYMSIQGAPNGMIKAE